MRTREPHTIDIYVGNKIRQARVLRKLTQTALAEKIGITFQQLQKYENAHNRVSCSRLYAIGRVLGMPVQAFFPGAPYDDKAQEGNNVPHGDALDLVGEYSRLGPALRRSLAKTVKSLADSTGEDS